MSLCGLQTDYVVAKQNPHRQKKEHNRQQLDSSDTSSGAGVGDEGRVIMSCAQCTGRGQGVKTLTQTITRLPGPCRTHTVCITNEYMRYLSVRTWGHTNARWVLEVYLLIEVIH